MKYAAQDKIFCSYCQDHVSIVGSNNGSLIRFCSYHAKIQVCSTFELLGMILSRDDGHGELFFLEYVKDLESLLNALVEAEVIV